MKRVYIYCEGPTEESFIKKVLTPYFMNLDIYVTPIVCSTKRTPQHKFKGGVSRYRLIKEELLKICRSHKNEFVTTMFDYYGMPNDTPGIGYTELDLFKKVEAIEQILTDDIGESNCKFNLSLHEFEGLLFSHPESFSLITDEDSKRRLMTIRDSFVTPEHINNSSLTAPSKRILEIIPNYGKVVDGTLLALDMGIDVILSECAHFRSWIDTIKSS